MEEGAGIWLRVVNRGDKASVILKAGVIVLENAVVEAAMGQLVTIGERAIISYGAIIHGAQVGRGTVAGIGSMVRDTAFLAEDVIVVSGAWCPGKGTRSPPSGAGTAGKSGAGVGRKGLGAEGYRVGSPGGED